MNTIRPLEDIDRELAALVQLRAAARVDSRRDVDKISQLSRTIAALIEERLQARKDQP